MDRQMMQDYDFYNSDDYPTAVSHGSYHLFTDLPGTSSEAFFNSGLQNTYPDILEPYSNTQEKFQITKPSSLLPGSQAPAEVVENKEPNVSVLINKQMKQEGFGDESESIRKIDPDILRAMQTATVGTARIKSSDRFSAKLNGKQGNKKLKKLDTKDKFKLI